LWILLLSLFLLLFGVSGVLTRNQIVIFQKLPAPIFSGITSIKQQALFIVFLLPFLL
jgi:hypothetical protein